VRPLVLFLLAVVLASLQAALQRHLGGGAVTVCLLVPVLVHLSLSAGNVDGAVGAAAVGAPLSSVNRPAVAKKETVSDSAMVRPAAW